MILKKGTSELPTLLLLHGWGLRGEDLSVLQDELEQRGHQILAPNLPGFGDESLPYAWDLADYARWIDTYLNGHQQKKVVVIGYSFGGRVAIKSALVAPDKITALVLIASAGIREKGVKIKIGSLLAKGGGRVFKLPGLNLFAKPARRILYFFLREKDYWQAGSLRSTMTKIVAEDLREGAKKINLPTLLIWGDKDKTTPLRHARIFQQNLRSAHLRIIPGATHSIIRTHPTQLAVAIDRFVKNL